MVKTELLNLETKFLWAGAASLTIHGEADISTTPKIEKTVDGLIKSSVDNLLIDLTPTTFMDCNFLSALIRKKRDISEKGGEMALVFNSDHFHKIFHITGLNRIFHIFDTEEEGINALFEARERMAVAV
jgi:anti-sigma B factor antagonist